MAAPFLYHIKEMRNKGMVTERYYRVYNRCKHIIGVQLVNGRSLMIRPNSFQMLSAEDIAYIESVCRTVRYFSSKILVPTDNHGNEIPLEEFGIPVYEGDAVHMNDNEINAMLKKPVKQVEAWLNNIEDPAELHAIFLEAKKMDLSAAKLKLLTAKMPNKDFLGE